MRLIVPITFAITDTVVATLSLLSAYSLREQVLPNLLLLDPFSPVRTYLSLWPVIVLLLIVRGLFGLYPGYGLHPAEELRRETLSTVFLAFLVLAGGSVFQFSSDYSRAVILMTFLFLLVLLPATRALMKSLLSRTGFYGEGVWLVGGSARAEELLRIIEAAPTFGLRVVGRSEGAPPEEVTCPHCLLVPDEAVDLASLLDTLNRRFKQVWLVPNLLDVASVWVTPRDLQGHLALELRNNLLNLRNQLTKLSLDLVLVLVSLPFIFLLGLLLAVAIRLDSSGPIFIKQCRLGRDGKKLVVYKFRTMVLDAETYLETYLAHHTEAREEWRLSRKLRDDPRVTRVGRLLRRYSLDELPQVINILRGDMSLVGPRPIMPDELEWYGDKAHLYLQVRPGLTGLSQVSGRSDLSYEQRVRLNSYYVRNWSVWLDIYVISKTLPVVLSARGAY